MNGYYWMCGALFGVSIAIGCIPISIIMLGLTGFLFYVDYRDGNEWWK